MLRTLICAVLLVVILLMPTGCIAVGWASKGHLSKSPTLGQELIDLKEALDDGSISRQEYEKAKYELLNKEDKA